MNVSQLHAFATFMTITFVTWWNGRRVTAWKHSTHCVALWWHSHNYNWWNKIISPNLVYHTTTLLTHWGRVTHICVSKQTIIGWDNGLSPGRRQAIIWTNAGMLLNGTLGTNFSAILIEIRIFSLKKMGLKVSTAEWRPFCLGLNVLT